MLRHLVLCLECNRTMENQPYIHKNTDENKNGKTLSRSKTKSKIPIWYVRINMINDPDWMDA